MIQVYEAINGQRIEFTHTPETEAFLKRVLALSENPKAKANDMIALVYSKENPILDQTVFPTRGAVTKEVLDHPLYHVFSDLIFRKECAEDGTQIESLAEQYTLTMTEAAEQLKIHASSIQKAIAGRRLPVWMKEGRYYLDPKTFHLLGAVGQRGPGSPDVQPLAYRVGHNKEHLVRLKTVEGEPDAKQKPAEGQVDRWRRAAVLHSHAGKSRLFVLSPGANENTLEWDGFRVKGHFEIVERVNNSKNAQSAWNAFQPL